MTLISLKRTRKEAETEANKLRKFNARMRKQSPENKKTFATKIVIKKISPDKYGFKYEVRTAPAKRRKR